MMDVSLDKGYGNYKYSDDEDDNNEYTTATISSKISQPQAR